MNINELAEGLHPLERKVLPFLNKCDGLKELQEKSGLQEIEVSRALQWLENKGIVKTEKNNSQKYAFRAPHSKLLRVFIYFLFQRYKLH